MKIIIDWKKVWEDFDKWFDRYEVYSWEKQMIKIQKLVEEQLNNSTKFILHCKNNKKFSKESTKACG